MISLANIALIEKVNQTKMIEVNNCDLFSVFTSFQMRFLDCRSGAKVPSKSLLDVGVKNAIDASGFGEQMFLKRGGRYTWSKADMNLEW